MKNQKKRSNRFSLLNVLAACLVFSSVHVAYAAKKTPPPPPILAVKTLAVEPVPATYELRLPAVVEANLESQLGFKVGGRVESIGVDVGTVVTSGQVVATLENADYRNDIQQSEAALKQAQAEENNAKLQYGRIEKLWADGSIDVAELDSARAQARSTQAEVNRLTSSVAEAQLQLGYTLLTSPYNGIVAKREVNKYDIVEAGTPVVLLVDTEVLKVQGQLSTARISDRQHFTAYRCEFPSLNGLVCEATLKGISPRALSPTWTFPIDVSIKPPTGAGILPGMNALLVITVKRASGAGVMIIPTTAVDTKSKGQPIIWVVNTKDSTVHSKPVKLGAMTATGLVIEEGLTAGDLVVTAGILQLHEGEKVTLL